MFVSRQLNSELNVNKPVSNFLDRYWLFIGFILIQERKSPNLHISTPKLEAVVSENSNAHASNSFDTFN